MVVWGAAEPLVGRLNHGLGSATVQTRTVVFGGMRVTVEHKPRCRRLKAALRCPQMARGGKAEEQG
jgi:hypothetical protein